MRTIVAGSRTITSSAIVYRAIAESNIPISVVLSGCAQGVDSLGEVWASDHGVPVESCPADWDTYGQTAGLRRNSLMVSKAEALVAVWDGKSPGTRDVIAKAKRAGLRVFIYYVA